MMNLDVLIQELNLDPKLKDLKFSKFLSELSSEDFGKTESKNYLKSKIPELKKEYKIES